MTTAAWRAANGDSHRASSLRYYRRNPEKVRAANRAWHAKNREPVKAKNRDQYLHRKAVLDRFKRIKGCAVCGYREHVAALVFHHRDPSQKTDAPSAFLRSGLKNVKSEIAKCDVLCANCHAITHFDLREATA